MTLDVVWLVCQDVRKAKMPKYLEDLRKLRIQVLVRPTFNASQLPLLLNAELMRTPIPASNGQACQTSVNGKS
jgi:hypothetical protein